MTDHIMLDLETLSTKPTAVILSIGAVLFTEQGIHEQFYTAIKQPEDLMGSWALDGRFHVEQSTLDWWDKQSPEARLVFTDPKALEIENALDAFTAWIYDVTEDWQQVRMWGNGSSFDNVILSHAYWRCEYKQPWKFYNDRCYRTVKNMYPNVKKRRVGTHHHALDDAVTQAQHLLDTGAYLG